MFRLFLAFIIGLFLIVIYGLFAGEFTREEFIINIGLLFYVVMFTIIGF